MDVARGLPALTIVGLPDQAVKEARERVRTAIVNSQFRLPSQRLTVNLAPADVKKEGGVFDLAIALGILAASGQVDPTEVANVVALGELALDGSLRPIRGVLPITLALRHARRRRLLVPTANAAEAAVAGVADVLPAACLRDAVDWLSGSVAPASLQKSRPTRTRWAPRYDVDFAEVNGQAHAKRALEVAVKKCPS